MKTQHKTTAPARSRIDQSGTDPNRYDKYYSEQEALDLSKEQTQFAPNVSNLERLLTVAAGSFLLYRALSGKKKNIAQGITGGTLLARGLSGYCPMYDMAGKHGKNVVIRSSVVVNKPVAEVYAFWRKLDNLPLFMKHLESVSEHDRQRSQWRAKALGGLIHPTWEAEILMDEPSKLLSWHSLPGSSIDNNGKIVFRDLGGKTQLDIMLSYHAPFGKAGEKAAGLFTPLFERMVQEDVDGFKDYIESNQ